MEEVSLLFTIIYISTTDYYNLARDILVCGIIKSVPYNQCIRKFKLNYPCKIVKKICKMLILTNTV